ncbi:hypothetical protein CROQUDRAFT_653101, partial [Cronartium quercuum f. sp. fusiforme G11]
MTLKLEHSLITFDFNPLHSINSSFINSHDVHQNILIINTNTLISNFHSSSHLNKSNSSTTLSPTIETNQLSSSPYHPHHQHPRKASATVSVSVSLSGIFDNPISSPTSHSIPSPTNSRPSRKQSIDSIWQGAGCHSRSSTESTHPISRPSPISTPSTINQLELPSQLQPQPPIFHHLSSTLYPRSSRKVTDENDPIVHIKIIDHLLQPWQEPHHSASLVLTQHGTLLKISLLDAHIHQSISIFPDNSTLIEFTTFATFNHPTTNNSFILCLAPNQAIAVIVQLPNLNVLPTLLELPEYSYLQLAFNQTHDNLTLVGFTSSGELVSYELEFQITEPFQLIIRSSRILGSLDFEPDGLALDENHIALWSHRAIYLISINQATINAPNSALTKLRSDQSESIIALAFLSPSLLSVLTATNLTIYRLGKTTSVLHVLIPSSKTLCFESVIPSSEGDNEFLAIILDTASGVRSIRHMYSNTTEEKVLYTPPSATSKDGDPITAQAWLDPQTFGQVLLGHTSGRISTHPLLPNVTLTSPQSLAGPVSALYSTQEGLIIAGSDIGDVGIFGPDLSLLAWTLIGPVKVQSVGVITNEKFVAIMEGGKILVLKWIDEKIEILIQWQHKSNFNKIESLWIDKTNFNLWVQVGLRYYEINDQYSNIFIEEGNQDKVIDWDEVKMSEGLKVDIRELVEGAYGSSTILIAKLIVTELARWGKDKRLDRCIKIGLGVSCNQKQFIDGEYGVTETIELLKLVICLRLFLDEPSIERSTNEALYLLSLNSKPHLGTLAKYWLDKSIEVRLSTKMIMINNLKQSSENVIIDLINRWEPLLLLKTDNEVELKDEDEKLFKLSILIIGIITSERYKLLSTKTLKNLSVIVFNELKFNNNNNKILLEVIEICGLTFEIIQNYIDAIELLKNLFNLATNTNVNINNNNTIKNDYDQSLLGSLAKQAVLHVAEINSPLFITTLIYNMMLSENVNDRISSMKLIIFMVRKKPLVLYTSLPKLIEVIINTLNPINKEMRKLTQSSIQIVLKELIRTYKNISYNLLKQKLAIGTIEGTIILYDLKSCTKINILNENFKSSINLLSFSPDGSRLVICSLNDHKIEVWKLNSFGFFSNFFNNFLSNNSSTTLGNNGVSTSSSTSTSTSSEIINGSNNNNGIGGNSKPFKSFNFNIGEEE